MKIRTLLITLTFALLTTATTSAQEMVIIGGVKYAIHNVVKGDTLYSLARHYGVTIDDIHEANPSLADGLKAGARIKIPVDKRLKSETKEKTTHRQHKVVRGETLYSLAKANGVSVAEIQEANPHIKKGLKAGQIITIPTKQSVAQIEQPTPTTKKATPTPKPVATPHSKVVQPQEVASQPTQEVAPQTPEEVAPQTPQPEILQEQFRALHRGDVAEVALLLPLGSKERPSQNYLDLYRGFLLGLDSIRMEGYSINLNLYNTAHDHFRIEEIIASGELAKANLVVGPVYEDELIPIATALQGKRVPIVSPLANLTATTSNTVFQMSPSPKSKFEKAAPLFDGSKRVVIISTDNVDKEFDAEVRSMLKDTSYVVEHKYIYEHPSIIEKREKEREKMRAEGLEVDETPSPSDMSPLLRSEQETVFVITANNEVEVDRILAAIASANIALTARAQRPAPFVIFGNNHWNRYRNIDRSILFTNNVTMLSTYHAHRSEPKIKQFDKRFVEAYGSLPSLYAYRGYDAAMVFVKALYDNIESGLEGAHFIPLLSPYTFETDAQSGLHINNSWVKVNYNSNYTITIE